MNEFIVTLDVDWAPDFVIDDVAAILVASGVKATWFITHQSPALVRLRNHSELFELGIHPNFLAGSTHGDHPRGIVDHLLAIVPDAVSARSHAVFQSAHILHLLLKETPIRVDSSILLPEMEHIRPVAHWIGSECLVRVPMFWTDDYVLSSRRQQWAVDDYLNVPGLKVMDFHPIHIFLNSASGEAYSNLKSASHALTALKESEALRFVNRGIGARSMFIALLEHIAKVGTSKCIRDLYLDHCVAAGLRA
jgi:hypothetical protein